MVCDRCRKREASAYIRTTINGRMTEKHLCSDCARLEGVGGESFFEGFFEDFFTPVISFGRTPASCFAGATRGGSIIDQAKDSIRLGANKFRDEVKDNPNTLKLMNLKRELAQVVEEENYERASEIKKQIDSIEKGDNNVQ